MPDIRSVDYKICTGCAACANLCPKEAIVMRENGEGFLYPEIEEEKCVHCGICYQRCPAIYPKYENNATPDCYAVGGKDELREVSSSGGMFSILAEYVLGRNGYVCGAAYTEEKTTVRHVIISEWSDLPRLRGSKYIQSEIGTVYKQLKEKLLTGAPVLFVGCPCQVAGLKSYLGKEYDNLITADLVCHGVPSHLVFEKFIKELPNQSEIVSVNFRQKKKYGWTHALQIEYKKGEEYYKPRWECDFYRAFLDGLAMRKSCGRCRFNKLPRQGDFTLGDFWGIEKEYKEFDDNKGVSLVLLNTARAKEIFEVCKRKFIRFEHVDIELARKSNGNVFASSKEHWERDRFMKIIQKYSFSSSYKRIKGRWFDVGIVGWWYGKNYGSALTYYALHEVVEGMGYDTLMLEWPWKKKPFPPISDNFVRRFAKKHYQISAQYTFDEYPSLNNHMGTFLVGSDQLWNYWDSKDMGNYYMLDFVREDRKKISYATSFGHPKYAAPKEVCEKQAEILKTFDAISVREDDGVKICRDVFGVNAAQVLDPVFLCPKEKYMSLIGEAKIQFEKPYLLAYILSPDKAKGEALQKAAEKLGLELLIILDGQTDLEENKKRLGIENVRQNVGIEDWLAYIYHASFVITDSFHGTCFSLIFEKQFICVMNKERGISRFNTLFSKLQLQNIAVGDIRDIDSKIDSKLKIDYININKLLHAETDRSILWLRNALRKQHVQGKKNNLIEQEPKKPEMNIMLIIDDNYLFYSLPCIYSLIVNNKWAHIHFYIVTDKLSQLNREYLSRFVRSFSSIIDFYEAEVDAFKGLKTSISYPVLLYSKLIPHLILPKSIKTVLYLDCDMIITNSLEELYNTNLLDKYIAASYDVGPFRRLMNGEIKSERIKREYINSGTVLYNLELMRNDNITLNTFLKWLDHNKQTLYEEQLISNVFLGKIYHLMPYDYNYNVGERNRYEEFCNRNNVVAKKAIIHYMPFQNDSPIKKPWNAYQYFYYNKPNDIFPEDIYVIYKIWWEYAKNMPAYAIVGLMEKLNQSAAEKKVDEATLLREKWHIYANFFKMLLIENKKVVRTVGRLLEEALNLAGYKKIAIYGNTEITKVLIKILEDTDISIAYIVENISVDGYVTMTRQVTNYPAADIMIIADFANYVKINEKLKGHTSMPVKGALTFLNELIKSYKEF